MVTDAVTISRFRFLVCADDRIRFEEIPVAEGTRPPADAGDVAEPNPDACL